jgi:hypothetical protein
MKQTTLYTTINHLNQECVVNVQYGSANTKTGNSIQIWILPLSWITNGKDEMNNDSASCMDCIHSKGKNGSCYVRKGFAEYGLKSKVNSLHKQYINGNIVLRPVSDLPSIEGSKIMGKFVRFGAYGEPVLLGHSVVESIAQMAANFTGYTHQWHIPQYEWAKKYFMASVESDALMTKANSKGFRTFRVRTKKDTTHTNEVICPASKEGGRKLTCVNCVLCKGASSKAKNIVIIKH